MPVLRPATKWKALSDEGLSELSLWRNGEMDSQGEDRACLSPGIVLLSTMVMDAPGRHWIRTT